MDSDACCSFRILTSEVAMEIIVASGHLFRRELSSFILSEAGYTVLEASDRTALLQYLERRCPDLLVLDVQLRGLNSQDLEHSIQQREQNIPIILLTTQRHTNGNGKSELAVDVQIDAPSAPGDYITWPYQAEDLLSHVANALQRVNHPSFSPHSV